MTTTTEEIVKESVDKILNDPIEKIVNEALIDARHYGASNLGVIIKMACLKAQKLQIAEDAERATEVLRLAK